MKGKSALWEIDSNGVKAPNPITTNLYATFLKDEKF